MDNNEITKRADISPYDRAALLNSRINANAQIAADSMVAIGQDLKAMRDDKLYEQFGCASFEDYCDKHTPIKQRQAYNFIKCFEKYGDRLAELTNVGITKLALMSALDDEDRDALIENGEAEQLSVRELKERIKELQTKNEQLSLDLDSKGKEKTKLDKLKTEMEKLKTELAAQKDIQAKKDERIKELENKPVEVAVAQPSKADLDAIEKKTKAKHDKELKDALKKAADEQKAAVEAARNETAAEIERLKKENAVLQSNAKKAPPTSEKERIKLCIEEVQRNFNVALETIEKLSEKEQEAIKGKLKAAVERMGELLK